MMISSMRRTTTYNALLLYALLLLPGGLAYANTASKSVDIYLKNRLIEALALKDDRVDRFDAEVWLIDKFQRLKQRLKYKEYGDEELLTLLQLVHTEARRAQLSPELVLSVIQVESNFDRFAISSVGARGLMQVMPFWLKELGRPDDNLFELQTNLRFGCTILRYYLDMEKENLTRALARYNGSRGSYKYPRKVYKALRTTWYK